MREIGGRELQRILAICRLRRRDITRKARSDIVRYAHSDIIFASKTREAHITSEDISLTKCIELAAGEYN